MVRFWPTLGISCLLAGFLALVAYGVISAAGAVIIDPQGQWFGPWPMEGANDCRTKIYADGRFEMECKGKEKYAGVGQWSRERNQLTFDFQLFVREGRKIPNQSPMTFRIDGTANTMVLGRLQDAGEPYAWKRAKL